MNCTVENVRIKFLGDISQLNKSLIKIVHHAEEKTKNNTGVNLNIAFNYGARNELVHAMKSIINLSNSPPL